MGEYRTLRKKDGSTKRVYVPSSKKSSGDSGGSGGSKTSTIDYSWDPNKETASQYHDRIGAARGDSSEYLSSMKQMTSYLDKSTGSNRQVKASPYYADNFQTNSLINLPSAPAATDPGNLVNLLNGVTGVTQESTTTEGVTTTGSPTTDDESGYRAIFDWAMGEMKPPESQEALMRDIEREAGIKKKEKLVNDLQGRITSIVNQADADVLSLEGQGRGIPEPIIGGQQAKIRREAAITALPLQAQLSAAQGDLESARSYAERLFQVRSADAIAQYQFRSNVITAVVDYATGAETRRLAAIQDEQDKNFEREMTNLNNMNSLAQTAIEAGTPNLISAIMQLDPTDPAFNEKLGLLQAKVGYAANAGSGYEKPEKITVNGVDYFWDPATGQLVEPQIPGEQGDPIGSGQLSKELAQIDFVRNTAEEAKKVAHQAGSSLLFEGIKSWFAGEDTEFGRLKNLTESLRTNVLTMASDPEVREFFGPQMSEADVRMMVAGGTTLSAESNDPDTYTNEVDRIIEFADKAEYFVKTGKGVQVPVMLVDPVSGDSSYVQLGTAGAVQAVNDGLIIYYNGTEITYK